MRDDLRHSTSPPDAEAWVGWCCSYCGAPLVRRGSGLACRTEERWFATRDGVHLLLPEERWVAARAYREIRERMRKLRGRKPPEGLEVEHHLLDALERAEVAAGANILVIGHGERAERLLGGGHRLAVVDPGMEPGEVHASGRPCAEADLEALPLEPGRFDLVLAAGTLHHGSSLPRSLVELRRVTRRGGALLAFDSPVFRRRSDGEDQLARAMKEERALVGMAVPREARPGYLVRNELPDLFRDSGWSLQVLGWPGPTRERISDLLRRLRGRDAARYPVLLASRDG